ncbi:MAG TPA: hypothetical protein VFM57_02680 [Thermoleophilaceae bacterium]|nr:hypothetical protein [Thermoleophilaceae bacterium]
MRLFVFLATAGCLLVPAGALAGSAPTAPPLLQSWSDTGLIGADDDWSGVPAVVGYRGDGLVAEPGVDPRAVTADGSATPVDVTANRTDPRAVGLASGVAEFELADPVVAIQGSATASAPHLVISLDTRGRAGVSARLVLRDIDASAADALEPVAVQYRVGAGGAFTATPGGYVADATSGPGAANLVTPVLTTLPAAADNHPLVQIRVITTNAAGEDEWVGIDDIEVTARTVAGEPGMCTPPPPAPPPGPSPAPGPAPLPPLPPREPPVLSELSMTPETFRPTRKGAAIVRRGGSRVRFRLSRAALVRFDVTRAPEPEDLPGRATPGGTVSGGRFSARARRGLNRFRFSGRLRGRPLAPGEYVLRAMAVDRARRESAPARARFRIEQPSD